MVLFDFEKVLVYITLLKIKVELRDKEKTQVIQGRANDCPEVRVIPSVTACQLPTQAPLHKARGSCLEEALSRLPP